jgi:hypothetical protein
VTHEETLYKMISDMSGSIGRIEGGLAEVKGNQAEFRVSLLRLFEMHSHCSGPLAMGAVDELRSEFDQHLERTTTTKNKSSDDKISRPPKPPVLSDKTIQLIVLFAIVAVGGFSAAMQIFTP